MKPIFEALAWVIIVCLIMFACSPKQLGTSTGLVVSGYNEVVK